MVKTLVLVLIAEFWMTAGHICFKKSAGTSSGHGLGWLSSFIRVILGQPLLWLGVAAMLIGLFFWFAALGAGELSVVYPLGSVQYILILVATPVFLKEKIDAMKIIGTLLVTVGIVFITMSSTGH